VMLDSQPVIRGDGLEGIGDVAGRGGGRGLIRGKVVWKALDVGWRAAVGLS
jgi:hypothetical protein